MRSPLNLEAFDDVVLAFYDAALGVHPWSEPLRRTADMFGGIDAGLSIFSNDEGMMRDVVGFACGCGHAQEVHDYWRAEWDGTGVCPKQNYWAHNKRSKMHTTYDLADEAELRRSRYFYEFERRFDQLYGIALRVCGIAAEPTPHTGIVGITMTRKRGHPQRAECDLLLRLYPHIGRAMNVAVTRARASAMDTAFRQFANLAGQGVLVVDADGKVLSTNPYAESLLKAGDGLRQRGGRLTARMHGETTRLRALIKGAAGFGGNGTARTPGGALSISRANGKLPLSLVIAPLSANGADIFNVLAARAVIYISDPQAKLAVDEWHLAALYKLTEAEASVAARFLSGMGVTEIAENIGVTPRTVRFHFHNLFDKCQAGGQVELMRVLKNGLIHPRNPD